MKNERVLVTGGAGFIGSHLCKALQAAGAHVTVLDVMDPQVHGGVAAGQQLDESADVEYIVGDVTDFDVVSAALDGVTMVVHFAAAVGVGQSMYEIRRYCATNTMGTACLLDALAARQPSPVRRLLVASSMSVYGDGLYECAHCGRRTEAERSPDDLAARRWEPTSSCCSAAVRAVPTSEVKTLRPSSVYAINKRDQEELCLVVGRAYGISTVALRFFNVYGTGQALNNPYTGVIAIFAARLLSGRKPLIFEDGKQSRDFVHVDDVVRACVLALETDAAAYTAINVGSGSAITVAGIAEVLRMELGGPEPEILNTFRSGDVRHCFADITRARDLLGWEPRVTIAEGAPALVGWVRSQIADGERGELALAELIERGLVR